MDVSLASMPLVRPLGSLEQMFWFKNRHMPYHFALCAEIHGATTITGWAEALHAVQRRHPAFTVAITLDEDGIPCFHQSATDNAIPLHIVTGDGTGWEAEMERQLSVPFKTEEAPLVRATLLHQAQRAFLIMAAHHSIADAKSLVFAIRDMIRFMAGHTLDPLPPLGSLDILLRPFRTMQLGTVSATEAFPSPGSLNVYRADDGSRPSVEALELGQALTLEIRRRSGKEETTVHGALVAAAVEAARQTSTELSEATINVGSAVDFRDSVAGGERVGLLSGGGSILVSPDKRDFWEIARFARRCIAPVKAPQVMASLMSGLSDYLTTSRTDNDVAALMAGLRFDINISNLGNVSIETCFGGLRLAQLWGPAILAGFQGEQDIGIATTNGSLSLLHVSHSALPLFLQVMRDRLGIACSN
jgi:NRPS condensation-like uncharacterized protein